MKLKIIKRIKKLLIHARSARLIGSEQEAAAFEERIKKLREKHNVWEEIPLDDEVDFDPSEGFWSEPIFLMNSPMFRNRRILWEEILFVPCARFWDCRPLSFKTTNLKIVVGEKGNRKKAIESYLYFHPLAEKSAIEYIREIRTGGVHLTSALSRIKKQSFLHGFAEGLSQRLLIIKSAEGHLRQLEEYAGPAETPELKKAEEVAAGQLSGEVSSSEPSSTALVKSERIVITEQQRDLEKELSDLPPPPEPKQLMMDEDAFFDGFEKGCECRLPEAIAAKAMELKEKIEQAERRARAKRDEQMRNSFIRMVYRPGNYSTNSYSTFTGYQGKFDFED